MNRRERKKEETRSSIIDCALGLFKTKGFKQTSMEEIAEQSDVSKGTLYNYFPDKESILVGHFQSVIADYSMDIKESSLDGKDLKQRLHSLLDFKKGILGEDMELTGIYLKYRMQNLFNDDPFDNPDRSGLENVVLQIVKDAQQKKELRSDISSLTIARGFLLLTVNFFITTINSKDSSETDKLRDQMLELFLTGAKS